MNNTLYLLAADALLLSHAAFVLFIVVGLACIVIGKFQDWSWVCNPWFRAVHMAGIVFVMLQSWLGKLCPLTVWEMALRQKAGAAVYEGSFIAHWVESILYYSAPPWVFVTFYTLFAVVVIGSWAWVRPKSFFSKKVRLDNQ